MPYGKVTYAQAMVVTMRTLYGFQDETVTPWFKKYQELASTMDIETNLSDEELERLHITRKEFAKRLCIASQLNTVIQN